MSFPYLGENKPIDNTLRQSVEGAFVALADGYTHYELVGDETAETVVLVHGFSVPYFIWEPTFRALSDAGYRVLRYDLFGRGFSDRPKRAYRLDFFSQQLHDLLHALHITQPINLCGLSMGGAISATFTAQHPRHVKKLALFDPAGGATTPRPFAFNLVRIPLAGELLIGLFGEKILLKAMAADLYNPALVAEFLAKYRPQMQYHGFKRAILSTMRHDALGDSSAAYRRVGELGIPTLLIWGREDTTVPYDQAEKVTASLKHVRFHTIENSGHIPHYEKAEEVNPLLLDFLQN
jgi:pimeloyl-ACP methyl ester carboxylesterase